MGNVKIDLCVVYNKLTMAVNARTRIQREIDLLRRADPSPYYSIYPHPDNIHVWSANIHGLPALHQRGKNYDLEITLPSSCKSSRCN